MIKAIVTDIEGTTSSLSFVKDILFPYARKHIAQFVTEHANDNTVSPIIADIGKTVDRNLNLDESIDQLIQWIDEDKKITPLKSLQGLLWKKGYEDNDFNGHIYDDAYEQLTKWHAQGIPLYVYSSGSVYAQELLFGHTRFGDINSVFKGNFDTRIGSKVEAQSYKNIAEYINLPCNEILFLSDIKEELIAAEASGMKTIWLVREEDHIRDPSQPFQTASNFTEIDVATL